MTFLNISQKPGETISAYTERFVAAQEDLSRIGIVVQPDFLNSMLLLHKSSSEYNANKKVLVSEKGTLSTLSVINRLKANGQFLDAVNVRFHNVVPLGRR